MARYYVHIIMAQISYYKYPENLTLEISIKI